MKLFLLLSSFITLSGCVQKKWDKETLVNDCLKDFTKRNEERKMFTAVQLGRICDCVTDKILAKYKSSAEADKDEEGVGMIGSDCAMEVMKE